MIFRFVNWRLYRGSNISWTASAPIKVYRTATVFTLSTAFVSHASRPITAVLRFTARPSTGKQFGDSSRVSSLQSYFNGAYKLADLHFILLFRVIIAGFIDRNVTQGVGDSFTFLGMCSLSNAKFQCSYTYDGHNSILLCRMTVFT